MTARTPLREASSYVCPSKAEPRDVGDCAGLERTDGIGRGTVELDHRLDRCLERARGRDPIPLRLQDEARTQRFREEENVPRARTGLRPDPLRMHQAHDREAVLRLVVANGVTSREDRAGRAHPLLGTGEHLPEHLDGKLLGKRGNRERQQRSAAHREDVVERVRRGNGTEGPRIVDEWREEVDREHDRALVVEPVHRRVVGGIEPDEQVLRIGRNEPREQRLESCRRVLRGAHPPARASVGARPSPRRHCTEGHPAGEPKTALGEIQPLLPPPDTRPPPPRRPHLRRGTHRSIDSRR